MKSRYKYIFTPCKLPNFVNINILREFVKNDVKNNKDYFDELQMTYRISDAKKAEWMLSKSILNSKLVGNGNKNVDIIVRNKIGIDVSVLTLNKRFTNEKSVIQNFTNSNTLDLLFNNKDATHAVDIFKKQFTEKFSYISSNFSNNIINIYYVLFICKYKHIYLTCLKLNLDRIQYMKYDCLTKKCKNIFINNFINRKFGNVRLYKSKKRLELRLSKNILHNKCSIKII
jgi:hypothetical protein